MQQDEYLLFQIVVTAWMDEWEVNGREIKRGEEYSERENVIEWREDDIELDKEEIEIEGDRSGQEKGRNKRGYESVQPYM